MGRRIMENAAGDSGIHRRLHARIGEKMSDIGTIVERAMLAWWRANGEVEGLEFRFGPVMERQIFEARPSLYPTPKGSARMVQFLGMPVVVDDNIPRGEIHIVKDGKRLGKLTGLEIV